MEHFQTLFNWAQTDFLTPTRIKIFRKLYGDLESAFHKCNQDSLIKCGFSPQAVSTFLAQRKKIDFQKNRQIYQKIGAKLIFIEDSDYPQRLLQISSPPVFLFVLGEITRDDDFAFAVVGSRKMTTQGKRSIKDIVPDLIQSGFTIVSGLASGVDTQAHRQALESKGRTIAVLGSGVDIIWPGDNLNLARKIIKGHGAVISEFPIGMPPLKQNFPRRNRIISGLSKGVLIVEGAAKSGSLITAKTALEQNREIFAVPGGPNAPLSRGPNSIIQKGEAKLTTTAEDILVEFGIIKRTKGKLKINIKPTNKNEEVILNILNAEPKLFDEIVKESELHTALVSSTLTIMELKGYVTNIGMEQWAKN